MFNKVTIKNGKQAVQMFGPAQRGVAMAVADCVEDGTIPADYADNLFICVGVFIHWMAENDDKNQDYNYEATKLSINPAVAGEPWRLTWSSRRARSSTPSPPINKPGAAKACTGSGRCLAGARSDVLQALGPNTRKPERFGMTCRVRVAG